MEKHSCHRGLDFASTEGELRQPLEFFIPRVVSESPPALLEQGISALLKNEVVLAS